MRTENSIPSMGRVRRLIARWSCSMTLISYLVRRNLMGVSRSTSLAFSAARLAPLLSILTVSDSPFRAIDFSIRRRAAVLSRWACNGQSTMLPGFDGAVQVS